MSANAADKAISAQSLGLDLAGRAVLREASLDARRGELVALIGPNGAGKSTLLRALAGLQRPDRGTVQLDGAPLDGPAPGDRAKRVAYLAQERTVHWPLAARAIVALGRLPHLPPGRRMGAADARAVDAALTAMDVTHLADRPVQQLSGGERARVLLARALAQEPAVLLADEPTAGLDPAHQIALLQHLRRCAALGVTIVVALHDLALASQFADHVVLMKEGRTIAAGRPEAVLVDDVAGAAYGIRLATLVVDGRRIVVASDILTTRVP